MRTRQRHIPPLNAAPLSAEMQLKLEQKILQAVATGEKTKTQLYKRISGIKANSTELSRVLSEMQDRELISSRRVWRRHGCTLWALWDHPVHVEQRCVEAERRARELAWQEEQRRSKLLERHARRLDTLLNSCEQRIALRYGSQHRRWISVDEQTNAKQFRTSGFTRHGKSLRQDKNERN